MDDPFGRVALEARIDEYMSNDPLEIAKTSLSDIKELSDYEWPELASKIKLGELRLRQMGPAQMSFHVVAAPSQKAGLKFFNILGLLLPVVAIGLAIFVKWWLIFVAILSLYMFKTAKGFYSQAIIQCAMSSEKCFSFLFSRNVICLVGENGLVFCRNE